jgi:F420-0:gamma-glutamyl ligase
MMVDRDAAVDAVAAAADTVSGDHMEGTDLTLVDRCGTCWDSLGGSRQVTASMVAGCCCHASCHMVFHSHRPLRGRQHMVSFRA